MDSTRLRSTTSNAAPPRRSPGRRAPHRRRAVAAALAVVAAGWPAAVSGAQLSGGPEPTFCGYAGAAASVTGYATPASCAGGEAGSPGR